MSTLIPFACLALLGAAAGQACAGQQASTPPAQENAPASEAPAGRPAPKAAATSPIQQVTVNGSRADDTELRRISTASKLIFGREELDRNGDSSVGEVLKRLPGVTMGGRPGRGAGVRMRGLGSGYTQMLVNGERPPAGFSLESLSPDQVERIEVMRGPVAEHSTQAIAGTINIVLREGYQQKDIQLKLSDNIEQDRHGPNLSLTVPGKTGALTWLVNGSVFARRNHDQSSGLVEDTTESGVVQRAQQLSGESNSRSRGIHLSPRLSYRFDNGDTLTFQPFLMSSRSSGTADNAVAQSTGDIDPEYAHQHSVSTSSSSYMRGMGNWLHKIDGGAKVDVKFSFGSGRSDSAALRNTYDAAGAPKKTYTDADAARTRNFSTGGKYTTPLGQGHLLAAGWDAEAGSREQAHVALDDGSAQFDDSGASLSADTRRFAGFVQDEWDITPQWSVYLGLRWEGIRTGSSTTGADVRNTSSVWSPVLHTVWRIPGHQRDQVRASLTQPYRAPPLNDLIAVPSFSTDNRATRPDRMGNPALKPELSKGIDLAYEHYLSRSGILSASAFVRQIDNLIRRQTTQRDMGKGLRWVSTPVNIGQTTASGIELEAKFQLAELMADAPNVDLRSNYSRFWSRVDGIPGPDNRLDQQPKQTANFGLDYRMKAVPLTVGGAYNWTPATVVQTSVTENVGSGAKRQLDLYGLWKFSARTQLRIAANHLLAADYLSDRTVATNGLAQLATNAAHTYTTWSIRLEMKL
jgi:outer membrane receptor for ferrienterochelin and colicins